MQKLQDRSCLVGDVCIVSFGETKAFVKYQGEEPLPLLIPHQGKKTGRNEYIGKKKYSKILSSKDREGIELRWDQRRILSLKSKSKEGGEVNRKDYFALEPNSQWIILNRAGDTGNCLV